MVSKSVCAEGISQKMELLRWDDEVSRLRYAHLKALLPLQGRGRKITELLTENQRKQDAKFPQTIEEFRNMRTGSTQIGVARFLTLDATNDQNKQARENMLDHFNWAWRQVETLQNEYNNNVSSSISNLARMLVFIIKTRRISKQRSLIDYKRQEMRRTLGGSGSPLLA